MRLLKSPRVVVILGCTGSGKSKLALNIAREFESEIISADSMQVSALEMLSFTETSKNDAD